MLHHDPRLVLPCLMVLVLPVTAMSQSPAPASERKSHADRYGDPLPAGAITRIGTWRFRQTDTVTSLVFSRDGKMLISAGEQHSGRIPCWEAATGKLARFIPCQDWGAYCVALSQDGKLLASVSAGRNSIWIIDVATGKPIHRFGQDQMGVTHIAAAFSPDGKTLASSGAGGVLLWDVATGKLRRRFADWGSCWQLAYSPDSRLLAGTGDASAHLGETTSGKELWKASLGLGKRFGAGSVAFAPDGSVVACGFEDGSVRLLDAATGKERRRLPARHTDQVTAVAYAPGGKHIAYGSADGLLSICDLPTGKELHRIGGLESVCSLVFNPDGKVLASANGDYSIRLWSTADGKELVPFTGHRAFVDTLAFTSDGSGLVAGDCRGKVLLWDLATGEQVQAFEGHTEPINCLAITPDGKQVVSGCWGAKAYLWDLATGKKCLELKGHTDRIYTVAVSPDGRIIASASIDSTIRLWSAATGQEIKRLEGGAIWKWVQSLAFSRDGKRLFPAREDGTIRECEVATGNEVRCLSGHKGHATSIAVCPNGRHLVSGGEDTSIRIWDLVTGKEVQRLKGHTAAVRSLALAPNGRTLVSGHGDGAACLWELGSGQEIACFLGHREDVYGVAYAPDGRSVASCGRDMTIVHWDVTFPAGKADKLQHGNESAAIAAAWEALADSNAATAHRALWQMVRTPKLSVPFLRRQLQPVEAVSKDRIAALIRALDDEDYVTREEACRALDALDELAEPALRAALLGRPSLELKRRAERMLGDFEKRSRVPQRLRLGRAVAVLEHIKAPQAREILARLAQGAQESSLTQNARMALLRGAKRVPAP